MARLPRLAVADQAHLVLLRGHGGRPVFQDDVDRAAFVSALREACSVESVALHAYAILPIQVWLVCTPATAQALGRTMQLLGRRFSAAFNRRHDRRGSVWDGRYRATVVEGGTPLLEAMLFVDQAPLREGLVQSTLSAPWTSARQHLGHDSEFALTDAEVYWALGNTPFDRSAAYRALLEEPLNNELTRRLAQSAERGWAFGSLSFLEHLAQASARPVAPRRRGRPRKSATV